jgi:hypothetical protein
MPEIINPNKKSEIQKSYQNSQNTGNNNIVPQNQTAGYDFKMKEDYPDDNMEPEYEKY